MGSGAFIEPVVVVTLLFGGAWINRTTEGVVSRRNQSRQWSHLRKESMRASESGYDESAINPSCPANRSSSLFRPPPQPQKWRTRELQLLGYSKTIETPNTSIFRNRFLSRVLRVFPFLIEIWYWALIYWVYQLGRAFSALTIVKGTVNVARRHALLIIAWEKKLHIFWELPIQQFVMQYPTLMRYINWEYSFIHIPGTILFLVWLYYYTVTSNRQVQHRPGELEEVQGLPSGPWLFEARRRTMATCNLFAFLVFTLWPCMPPRLLSDKDAPLPLGEIARSFGFVDTVHGEHGAVSVWTANRFCNQWAAMPSLHFGYSLLVGVTIMTIPLSPQHRRSRSVHLPFFNQSHPNLAPRIKLLSTRRMLCIMAGFLYPFSIFIVIVATANHFILDAVAGAVVCALGWHVNKILLNLLPLEDYFLWCLRIHKPSYAAEEIDCPDLEREKL